MRRPLLPIAIAAILLTACGGDDDSAGTDAATTTAGDTAVTVSLVPVSAPADAPEVSLPAEVPTKLVVTEIIPGEGREAADGDTVIVNYVGVRTEDGTEFDSSYAGDPLPVVLGEGQVIPGWEQGLQGAQGGERLQLDIPSDLAYGDQPRGDVIKAGDALSFVIDVLAVVPATEAADAPTDADVPVSSEPVTELVVDDPRVGDGAELEAGMTAVVHLVAARADNGAVLQSTWTGGQPQAVAVARGQMLDGMVEGLPGMKVGGRRVLTIPSALAFGEQGMPQMGLPANTDLVVIADLLAAF